VAALVILFWIVVIGGFIAYAIRQKRREKLAKETTSVLTRYSEQQVVQVIESAFRQGVLSIGWKTAAGPGKINKSHTNYGTNIFLNLIFLFTQGETVKISTTMSFDITPEPNGVVRVDMWPSFGSQASIRSSVGAILRVKRTIGEALDELDSAQLAQQMYGSETHIPLDQPASPGGFPAAGQSYQPQSQPDDRRYQR
jgi:hypothetical protein